MASVSVLIQTLSVRTDERDRAQNNYNISTDSLNTFVDRSGKQALKIDELQLTKNEIEASKDSIIQKLVRENTNLGNKLKNTSQLINIKTIAKDSIILVLKDSIIYRQRDTITQIANYSDFWLDINLNLLEDVIELDYTFYDDLIISVGWHRKKLKFPPWNWLGFGKKIYDADIKSLNPNSNIIYSKNVVITGKRGRQ